MRNNFRTKRAKKIQEATVTIPLSDLRCLLGYPREKKIVCEISTVDLRRLNSAKTIDEVINAARLEYALGNYTTHKTAKSLIAALDA